MDKNNSSADVRWKQRLDNFKRAQRKFEEGVEMMTRRDTVISDEVLEMLREGLIQRFEYSHELAWKLMKDYEEFQGIREIRGSRDAIRNALAIGLIEDKEWMSTIETRNLSSHIYDREESEEILQRITKIYEPLFRKFKEKMILLEESADER